LSHDLTLMVSRTERGRRCRPVGWRCPARGDPVGWVVLVLA
jgi:hypothetical protein